jgi:ribosomal protein S18 acetylase RimI-like enzyme
MTLLTPSGFTMPAALARRGYALRPEEDADVPFLMLLFASTRAQELAGIDWPDDHKRMFLAQQFTAQRHHYRTQIDRCEFHVIERDGVPVGRLYLQERVTQLHIVDIALLPTETGQGAGTILLQALTDAAWSRDKGLGIFVEKNNPALRLYRRLGFVEIADTQIYWEMERVPAAPTVS